jgi:hypothetical protein
MTLAVLRSILLHFLMTQLVGVSGGLAVTAIELFTNPKTGTGIELHGTQCFYPSISP